MHELLTLLGRQEPLFAEDIEANEAELSAIVARRQASVDALREKLNMAITQIRSDGTYQKINKKYFDFDVYGD